MHTRRAATSERTTRGMSAAALCYAPADELRSALAHLVRHRVTTRSTPTSGAGEPEGAQAWAEDRAIVASALAGDALANERLFARLGCVPRIVAAIDARAGGPLSHGELSDLAQDVYLLVWRKRSAFDGRASLESWIYGIARFEYLNALRRRKRTREVDDQTPARAEGLDDDLPLEPEALRAALDALDPEEAEAVRLHHYEDLSFPDAAARAGVALGTLKNRYYRALERLRARLAAARRAGGKDR